MLENDIFIGTCFSGKSFVKVVTDRGKRLTKIMESNGLFLCNGRSDDDRPANYTFVGFQGKSVLDPNLVRLFCFEILLPL